MKRKNDLFLGCFAICLALVFKFILIVAIPSLLFYAASIELGYTIHYSVFAKILLGLWLISLSFKGSSSNSSLEDIANGRK